MMKKSLVALAVCAGFGVPASGLGIGMAAAAEPVLHVQVLPAHEGNEIELGLAEPVRLSALLEYLQQAHPRDVYWPQARLIALDRQDDVEAQRNSVVADLERLASYWQGRATSDGGFATELSRFGFGRSAAELQEKARWATALAEQIRNWNLGFQPYGAIDIAAARQRIADNPLIPSGRYQLWLPSRPDQVYVLGLTEQAGAVQHVPRQTVRGYVTGSEAGSAGTLADPNVVWYLGTGAVGSLATRSTASDIRELPWGVHNAGGDELRPGDVLFVGFDRWQLPREFRHLRDSVPALLAYFVSVEGMGFEGAGAAAGSDVGAGGAGSQTQANVPAANHWSRLSRPASPGGASPGNYGGAGLIQMANARFGDEGELRLSYTDMNEYRRYAVSLQVLDWVEATGFYVRVPSRLYSNSPGFSGDNIYTDKGFDLKLRVWQESQYLPQVAVGIKDIGGTGLFAAEYVVASKQVGPFDFSLGAGFGRMGTRDHFDSPFCTLVDSMCERPTGFSGRGGKFEYDSWFRGPMAMFAGVEYQTPWQSLRLKVEYDGNDYSNEAARVDMTPRTPINVGLNYRVNDFLDLYAGYERGDTFTFGFSLRTNLNTLSQPKILRDKVQPQPHEARTYEHVDTVNWRSVNRSLQRQYAYSGGRYLLEGSEEAQTVTVYTHPLRLRDGNEMIDRAARVLAQELPDSVKTYEFVEQSAFMPMVKTTVDAEAFKAAVDNRDPDVSPRDTSPLFVRSEPGARPDMNDDLWVYNPEYRFSNRYGVKPHIVQSFGAPETFHFYQVGAKAFARRWLTPKVELFGEVGVNLFNNFDRFNFTVDAFDFLPVPRVRTYVREYMLNDVWLDTLQATYYERVSDNVYAMAYGGMLERMYGGAGGELLYRPLDSNWAVGVDVNHVWQRDFEGAFGFRNYNETTGFVSLYYHVPWLHDSLVTLRAGQFLAGDKGVNVTFQRRFDSGVTVGAWASFTDVSTTDYGEGSFSKGFFLTIPFDIMSVFPSREHIGFSWVPLNRDGGQMLHRRSTLHSVTDPRAPYYNR